MSNEEKPSNESVILGRLEYAATRGTMSTADIERAVNHLMENSPNKPSLTLNIQAYPSLRDMVKAEKHKVLKKGA
jgi:hypothetical protein